VATGPPGPETESFDEISMNRPLALVFGNERTGLSPAMRTGCEGMISIPMQGFVESLNISVAAAIIVQNLTTRLRASDVEWPLTDAERQTLLLDWVRKSISAVQAIEQRWIEDQRRQAQANPPTLPPGQTP
jgi:tRNA (guanosine-2'-O-)-methyltransferase